MTFSTVALLASVRRRMLDLDVMKRKQKVADPTTICVKLPAALTKSIDVWAVAQTHKLGTIINRSDAVRMLLARAIQKG
jgi:hypothetical protein